MIRVEVGDLSSVKAEAILRPVAADGSAVTPTMRQLEVAAGRALAQRFGALGELPVGSAVITDAGDLQAEFLIHVVVRSREEAVSIPAVRTALRNGLRRAAEFGIETLYCAPVGLGAGNLALEDCAEAMRAEIVEGVEGVEGAEGVGGVERRIPREVVIVVDSDLEREVFEAVLGARG